MSGFRHFSSRASKEQKSRKMLFYLTGLVFAMVGSSYAAVPLYRRFCQATGYGGTVSRREVCWVLFPPNGFPFSHQIDWKFHFFLSIKLLNVDYKTLQSCRVSKKRLHDMIAIKQSPQGFVFLLLDVTFYLVIVIGLTFCFSGQWVYGHRDLGIVVQLSSN